MTPALRDWSPGCQLRRLGQSDGDISPPLFTLTVGRSFEVMPMEALRGVFVTRRLRSFPFYAEATLMLFDAPFRRTHTHTYTRVHSHARTHTRNSSTATHICSEGLAVAVAVAVVVAAPPPIPTGFLLSLLFRPVQISLPEMHICIMSTQRPETPIIKNSRTRQSRKLSALR
jgi:hypothetical protein